MSQSDCSHHPHLMAHEAGQIDELSKIKETPIPKRVCLNKAQINIGRAEGYDMRLPYVFISRNHAQISCKELENGEKNWYIADNGSSQGTFVNHVQIAKGSFVHIFDGSVIGFGASGKGSCQYLFQEASSRAPPNKMLNLLERYICSHCKKLMVHAVVTRCKHTYCHPCADTRIAWNKKCTVCLEQMQHPINRCVLIDETISWLLHEIRDEKLRTDWEKRMEQERFNVQEYQNLETEINSQTSLDIALLWNQEQRDAFKTGIRKYKCSRLRRKYCGAVHLSPSYLTNLDNLNVLKVVAKNVDVYDESRNLEQLKRAIKGAMEGV